MARQGGYMGEGCGGLEEDWNTLTHLTEAHPIPNACTHTHTYEHVQSPLLTPDPHTWMQNQQ